MHIRPLDSLALLVLICSLTGCMHNADGRRTMILVPAAQELKLGDDAFKEILTKEKVCNDATASALVTNIGNRVAAISPKPGWKWDFRLFDAPTTANAFALPGGKVGVYTGLFAAAATEAGLAAVMGHEVAHAIARHGAERITQSMLMDLGMQAAQITLDDSKNKGPIMGALGVGAQIGVALPFSRSMESEADKMGLVYMARAGYDPREAIGFWERFGKDTGSAPPEFLSTHPANQTRIEGLKATLPEALKAYEASARSGKGAALTTPGCGRS